MKYAMNLACFQISHSYFIKKKSEELFRKFLSTSCIFFLLIDFQQHIIIVCFIRFTVFRYYAICTS